MTGHACPHLTKTMTLKCSFPELLMIQESYNVIWHEIILVYLMKFHDHIKEKTHLLCSKFTNISLWTIFNPAIHPRPIKGNKSRHIWALLKISGHIQTKLKPSCRDCLHAKNLRYQLISFQSYWWSKNLANWLDKSLLAINLWSRIFPDTGFAQENWKS